MQLGRSPARFVTLSERRGSSLLRKLAMIRFRPRQVADALLSPATANAVGVLSLLALAGELAMVAIVPNAAGSL